MLCTMLFSHSFHISSVIKPLGLCSVQFRQFQKKLNLVGNIKDKVLFNNSNTGQLRLESESSRYFSQH